MQTNFSQKTQQLFRLLFRFFCELITSKNFLSDLLSPGKFLQDLHLTPKDCIFAPSKLFPIGYYPLWELEFLISKCSLMKTLHILIKGLFFASWKIRKGVFVFVWFFLRKNSKVNLLIKSYLYGPIAFFIFFLVFDQQLWSVTQATLRAKENVKFKTRRD